MLLPSILSAVHYYLLNASMMRYDVLDELNPHFSTVMLGLYIMSLCHVLWRHLHVYYIYWKNHICSGWDYPWIERKFLKNETNTLYCSISHWEEKCLFFSLLIFGLTQQRDTIDLTFCKTGQVYYRIQLNRKLRIFFSWKMMSQNES